MFGQDTSHSGERQLSTSSTCRQVGRNSFLEEETPPTSEPRRVRDARARRGRLLCGKAKTIFARMVETVSLLETFRPARA